LENPAKAPARFLQKGTNHWQPPYRN
jgi:hypothetical protein